MNSQRTDMAFTPNVCHLTSCKALEMDFQNPEEDSFWLSKMIEINVKATFNVRVYEEEEGEGEGEGKKLVLMESSACRKFVQEKLHKFPLEQLLNSAVMEDWSDTNIWDVFDSMSIPIQRSAIEQIVGCALAMAERECYKDRNVLRMLVEIETWVDDEYLELMVNYEEDDEDVYSINVEADDFWETVEAFKKLRNVEVKGGDRAENELCSICLGDFFVGSEISATPCSHVFHHRCIRAWLKKCNQKFCPNCVSILA